MTRMLTALGVCLLLAAPAYAQTGAISGTVVDESGAVVPGATVQLSGPGMHAPTVTGSRGEYRFMNLASGTYQVSVTLVGFAPATMSVLSAETLKTMPGQNYGDLLRAVPGVNVIQLSARDVNITSRQATSTLSNTELVLLDGRSIYLDFFGLVLWDFVPANLSDVKQIEVIRGPASAVWGANAFSGVVNILTKSPREAKGATVTLSAGMFNRDCDRCSTQGKGVGAIYGANATYADAPNAQWSYRVSGGYFNSDPLPRPTGTIPLITDPNDPAAKAGGAAYPADTAGALGSAYQNQGTSQPRFDARVDQEIAGGRITYAGGVAGSSGIVYTGIGPFDVQKGSVIGYGKVNYSKDALKVNFFANITNAEAPNLLLADPSTGKPVQLNFKTQTYDVEVGDAIRAGMHQVFTFGGNVRRNNFDITIAPAAENRTEAGAYVQDEILLDKVHFVVGGRVDKFGNINDAVFSPRLAAIVKPMKDQSIRVSFNRAFRAPSVINNFLDTKIVTPISLAALGIPVFPLVVRAVGSNLPIGSTAQPPLTQESVNAYEVAYTGTILERTTVGVAAYINDIHDQIAFVQISSKLDPYTAASPPPGWPLPPGLLTLLQLQGVYLPRTAFTYQNLGPIRHKGVELSVDHRFDKSTSAFINYSWQAKPDVLSDANPFPAAKLALPPTNRFNAGVNYDGPRLLGAASANYSDKAFWTDVLTAAYHGFTDSYTMVNGTFGVKWMQGKVTTLVKVNNIFNEDVQQHVFGDILKRSTVFEVRITQ